MLSDVWVELSIFSGRPNPTWSLTPEQADDLKSRVLGLPILPQPGAAGDGLGYRGFIVTYEASDSQTRERLVVFRDQVILDAGGIVSGRADPRREIENWLVRTAEGCVETTVLEHLKSV